MKSTSTRRPPLIARAMIRLALSSSVVRETILGDLAEEFHARHREKGSGAAARWYWKQALSVATWALSDRLTGHSWSRIETSWEDREFSPVPRRFRPSLGIGHLGLDIRASFRQLVRRPGFTLAAVLSLALGIGANTAVFSVVNSILLRPFGVVEAERLTPLFTSQVGGQRHGNTSFPDYLDYRERNGVFSGIAAYAMAPMALTGDGVPRVTWGQLVNGEFFSVLGVEAVLGRTFLPEEDEAFGAHPVVVLSHITWENDFGADPGVLGQTVRINDFPFTVIGVAPPGFTGLMPVLKPALWAPLAMMEQALPFSPNVGSRVDPWIQLVGRLNPGMSVENAQASLDVLAADMAAEYPGTNRNKGIVIESLDAVRLGSPGATDGARNLLAILLGVVGFVLFIACFNVANLELAKAAGRRREIALRHSLGASRWRIVRQLLSESLLLALLAGGAGLVVSAYSLKGLQLLQAQTEAPLSIPSGLDGQVLGFTLILSLGTAVLFGLAPALQVLKPGQSDALKNEGYALSRTKGAGRLQNGLVVAQVALSLVLLTGAGLLLRSLNNTLAIDPGFDLRQGVVASVNLGYGQYSEEEGRMLHRNLLDRVASLPQVQSAALTSFVPLGMVHGHHDVQVEGYEPAPEEFLLVKRNLVSAGYFETMGIRVVRGRAIDERDTEGSQPVAMVNEVMAQRFWPGQDPVGRTVQADLGRVYTVVGIIEDGKYSALLEAPEPYLVLPISQAEYVQRLNLVARTRSAPEELVSRLSTELRELVPGLPHSSVLTISRYLEYSEGNARGPAMMVGIFGLLALVLAAVGLFGVMSYNVRQRIREFGVRFAVGATTAGVAKMVLLRGLKTTVVGLVIGGLLAVAVTRILSGLLFEVNPLDPIVFFSGAGILLGVGQIASYLPARFASKADPVTALRAE